MSTQPETARFAEVHAWLKTNFPGVRNRSRWVCHDETEPMRDEFVVPYRDHSWVIRAEVTAAEVAVAVLMPTHAADTFLGRFPFPSPALREQIMISIDPKVSGDIVLSADGDTAILPAGATETTPVSSTRHRFCSGSIAACQITETLQAFTCDRCYLRFVVPLTVQTYGDLRTNRKLVLTSATLLGGSRNP